MRKDALGDLSHSTSHTMNELHDQKPVFVFSRAGTERRFV